MDTLDTLKQQIAEHKIILFMKGSPEQPRCGFSARAVECLQGCHVDFAHVDILQKP